MYESFYHLHSNPFSLTPDPKFCFGHSGYRQAHEYLEYALKLGEGLVMITGSPGTGKTTVVESFLSSLNMGTVKTARIAASSLDANDLLRAVAYAFDIETEHDDRATLRHRIRQFFEKLKQSGRRTLLIIDEAQGLPHPALDELRLLADLQSGSCQLLQLFLVGQEQLRELMSVPEMEFFQQRVIANYHLVPMSLMESRDYIEYRLRRAGWQGDPELTGNAVLDIYRYSKGVPRHINKLCNRLLLLGYGTGSHTLNRDDVQAIAKEMDAELLRPISGEQAVGDKADITLDSGEIQPGMLSDLAIKETKPLPVVIAASSGSAAGDNTPQLDRPAGQQAADTYAAIAAGETIDAVPYGQAPQRTVFHGCSRIGNGRPATVNRWQSRFAFSLLVLTVGCLTTAALTNIIENEGTRYPGMPISGAKQLYTVQTHTGQYEMDGEQVFSDTVQVQAEPDEMLLQGVHVDELPAPAAGILLNTAPPDSSNARPLNTLLAEVQTFNSAVDHPLSEVQASTSQDAEIDYLLVLGREALSEFRLLTPPMDSAYYYFQSALRMAPGNADAIAGIREITDRYVLLAKKAFERQDSIMADRYIARGLCLQPGNSVLRSLKEVLHDPVLSLDVQNDEISAKSDDWHKVGDVFSRVETFISSSDQKQPENMATYQVTSSYIHE